MPHKKPQKPHPSPTSIVLVSAAALLLAASAMLTWRFGAPAYFAVTGRPLHWPPTRSVIVNAPSLPHFMVNAALARPALSSGATQTITITATSDLAASASIEAWLTSPTRKQVWRSPDGTLTKFPAGRAVTTTYTFVPPPSLAPGDYKLSVIMNSADGNTDYYAKENFAEFSLN